MDLDREDAAEGPPDASSVLHAIRQADQRIYLLLDFHPYLGYASHQRLLRDIVQRRLGTHVVVLVGAKVELPSGLDAMAVRFSPRLPDARCWKLVRRKPQPMRGKEHGGRRVEAEEDAVRQDVRHLQGLDLHDARRIARQLIMPTARSPPPTCRSWPG